MNLFNRNGVLKSPTREVLVAGANSFIIRVTPVDNLGPPKEVCVTKHQLRRYHEWREHRILIQDALPELSEQQREILMTGLADG